MGALGSGAAEGDRLDGGEGGEAVSDAVEEDAGDGSVHDEVTVGEAGLGELSRSRTSTPRVPAPPYARGALKKLYREGMPRREAALAALHALYDAADDDSATGGPDINRRIFPIVSVITEDGFERLPDPEAEELSREMVEQRRTQPDGPTAATL